jgi:hypothetical protein
MATQQDDSSDLSRRSMLKQSASSWWYAEQELPSNRFDEISAMPGQVEAKAMSPLCHTSVSKWALTAGAEVTSKEKLECCREVDRYGVLQHLRG